MKTTIKHQRNQQQQRLNEEIGLLLGLSNHQLQIMIFEAGCHYMECLTGMETVAQQFLTHPMYWQWWRQQWAIIDAQFMLMHANAPLKSQTLRRLYDKMHREIDTWPDAIVWRHVHDAYEQMMLQVIKTI